MSDADIQRSKDSRGRFYRAGSDGRKFYYKPGDKGSRQQAKRLARQSAKKGD